jgi:hypothetical protein
MHIFKSLTFYVAYIMAFVLTLIARSVRNPAHCAIASVGRLKWRFVVFLFYISGDFFNS